MNKNDDLISRAAAIEAFDDERVDRNYGDVSPESVIKVIESIPAVDAAPVVHARWVEETDYSYHWFCSNCKQVWGMTKYFMKFCPSCGAFMNLEE